MGTAPGRLSVAGHSGQYVESARCPRRRPAGWDTACPAGARDGGANPETRPVCDARKRRRRPARPSHELRGPCRGHPGHSGQERGLPPHVTVSQAHAHVIKNQAQPRSVSEALCPAVATKTTVPGTGLRQHQLPRTGPSCPRGGPVPPAQERGCSQNPGAAGARRALSVHAWRVGVGRGGVG